MLVPGGERPEAGVVKLYKYGGLETHHFRALYLVLECFLPAMSTMTLAQSPAGSKFGTLKPQAQPPCRVRIEPRELQQGSRCPTSEFEGLWHPVQLAGYRLPAGLWVRRLPENW